MRDPGPRGGSWYEMGALLLSTSDHAHAGNLRGSRETESDPSHGLSAAQMSPPPASSGRDSGRCGQPESLWVDGRMLPTARRPR